MRKTITGGAGRSERSAEQWLDLDALADVEVTSEDPDHPIEHALLGEAAGGGWRAGGPGTQTVRLLFKEAVSLTRLRLVFQEELRGRTQEFVLRWSAGAGNPPREIVRQQYTFSPPGTSRQTEDYRVDLQSVRELELTIVPEIGGGDAVATLERWRVG